MPSPSRREQVAHKIKLLAADALEASSEDIELRDGYARVRGIPTRDCRSARRRRARIGIRPVCRDGTAPGIHETAVVSPPVLGSPDDDDRIASAATFGFVIDLAAVEIDPKTGAIRIDKYASVHDVGTQLNPRIVEGQVHGGFAHGLGAALFEELAYDERGNFLSGTFADYLCPTAVEVPPLEIGHVETPSPVNALGAKGMGDGSSMLTPAAIANAVADALGRDDIVLPLNLAARLGAGERPRSAGQRPPAAATRRGSAGRGRARCTGEGEVMLSAPVEEVWRRLDRSEELAAIVPGCRSLTQDGPDRYSAQVVIGVAGIRGTYDARYRDARQAGRQIRSPRGQGVGRLGLRIGLGLRHLDPEADGRTRLHYRYEADVGGKVAAVGQRMLGSVTQATDRSILSLAGAADQPAPEARWKRWFLRRRLRRRERGGASR